MKNSMNVTVPSALGVNKGFSLSKDQKKSRRDDDVSGDPRQKTMQTTQNSLNKYKNVFQKTVNGGFGGFRRKITIDEGNTTPLDIKSQSDESSMERKNFASLISSKGSHEENVMIIKDSKTNIVHLDTNIDKVGRRTQQKISINDS